MVALAHPRQTPAEDATSSFPGSTGVKGTYLDEVLMMRNAAGTKYYYHTNHLYSVHAITNQSGAIVEAVQSYDSYGKPTILTGAGTDATWFTGDDVVGSASAIGNPWFYTGQRLDAETGLMYYKNRYYSVDLGRFISRDPIGYRDGSHLYCYVGAALTIKADPYGLSSYSECMQNCMKNSKGGNPDRARESCDTACSKEFPAPTGSRIPLGPDELPPGSQEAPNTGMYIYDNESGVGFRSKWLWECKCDEYVILHVKQTVEVSGHQPETTFIIEGWKTDPNANQAGPDPHDLDFQLPLKSRKKDLKIKATVVITLCCGKYDDKPWPPGKSDPETDATVKVGKSSFISGGSDLSKYTEGLGKIKCTGKVTKYTLQFTYESGGIPKLEKKE